MRVWLYSRLSRDEDKELNSMTNQRNILIEFANANNYEVMGESSDDNISGMHFNRPGIYEITEQVENKNIDAIIVKDLSRLGRHRTQTAMFIDYLRENNVKVLSVTEGIDTSNEDDDLMIGFKGVFNDLYARDISKKIRSGFNQKQKNGIVIIPPLGYFKDKNTDEVVVVEEHAEIVRKIFDLYLEGYGFSAIAKKLNEEGIKSPAYYQNKLLGKKLGYNKPEIGRRYLWDHTGVKRILQNEFYIGTLICHKTYTNKINHIRRDIPEDEQYRHEDFVPKIISQDKWEQVQFLINHKNKRNVRAGTNNPCHRYAGLLKCGNCGSSFTSKTRKYRENPPRVEYVCNGYHRYGKENCTSHRINESEIDELIYKEILNIKEIAINNYKNIETDIRNWMSQKNTVEGRIKYLTETLEQRKNDQKEILLARIRDREHESTYTEMLVSCEDDIKKCQTEIDSIKNYNKTIRKRKSEIKKTVDLIEDIVKDGAISNVNLRLLIEEILIYDSGNGLEIKIKLKANFTDHIVIFNSEGTPCGNLTLQHNTRQREKLLGK